MAENVLTNVTSNPPATTTTPASSTGLAKVRTGFANVLIAGALFLLVLGGYYLYDATYLGGGETPAETWNEGFKSRKVWPIAAWSLLFGVVGLGWSAKLLTSKSGADTPDKLSQLLAFSLFGVAACIACVPIFLLSTQSRELVLTPTFVAGIALALVSLGGGIILLLGEPGSGVERRLRLQLMGFALAAGVVLLGLGVALAVYTFNTNLTSGLDTWVKEPWILIWPTLAYLAGLALMFVGVQAATPLIRTDETTRRVVLGTNLAVSLLLLIGILTLPNVLAYAEPLNRTFGRAYNWTESGLHSLSPQMRNYLTELKTPVKIYAILPSNTSVHADTNTLLGNCRSINEQFKYEFIDAAADDLSERRQALLSKYGQPDQMGLLVTVGGEEKGDSAFIRGNDLLGRGGESGYVFKGEGKLLNALISLSEGKMKVYFPSGHGELALTEGRPKMPGMQPMEDEGQLGTLRQRLVARDSVTVESLPIGRETKQIPDDATVVVIANPTREFAAEEVNVLRDYLKRESKKRTEKSKNKGDRDREVEEVTAGKLLLLLGPNLQREKGQVGLVKTGLEGLLKENGVQLGNNRLLALRYRNPLEVPTIPDPRSNNPIARAFRVGNEPTALFDFINARSVEPIVEGGGGSNVEPILVGLVETGMWEETSFDVDPVAVRNNLLKNRELQQKTLLRRRAGVAVGVSTGGRPPGMPNDPAHAAAPTNEKPRMVVFGTSSWITDEGLRGREGQDRVALFTATLSWLNARSDAIAPGEIEDKARKVYKLNIAGDTTLLLLLLPLGLMVTMVLMLGLGVWVIRRR